MTTAIDLLIDFHAQVQQYCINCGICMGKYFCTICKFFDDDVSSSSVIEFASCFLLLFSVSLSCAYCIKKLFNLSDFKESIPLR